MPLLTWAVDPDKFGPDRWRDVALGIGLMILALALPLSRLVKNQPEEYGLRPDGDPEPRLEPSHLSGPGTTREDTAITDWTRQQAIRTRAFWLITMGHACSSIVIVTLMVHLGSMLNIDRAMALSTVGLVVSTYTGVGALFNLVGWYLGDRVPMRLALFGFSAVQSCGVIVLLMAQSAPVAFGAAVILGIGFGGRTPLTSAIRGTYFGRRAFASITGLSMMPMNVLLMGPHCLPATCSTYPEIRRTPGHGGGSQHDWIDPVPDVGGPRGRRTLGGEGSLTCPAWPSTAGERAIAGTAVHRGSAIQGYSLPWGPCFTISSQYSASLVSRK